MSLATLTVEAQSEQLRRREIAPVDLVDACLARIEALDPDLHALHEVFADEARARARALENESPGGPLWGIPWVAKDLLATRTGHTTCGSRALADYRSPFDATAVQRLEAAGAILLGKTNMDEFAMGSSTENSAWGPTRNPWDRERVPGGSSGGSAAAVAADLASFALGSDTGGSIRQPAALCGIVGMKPTYGRVSRWGLVAFASSLDQIGPFAKSVRDAAQVLQVIAGPDRRDSTCLATPVPALVPEARSSLEGVRVGVPREFVGAGLKPEIAAEFERVLGVLEKAGAVLVDVTLARARDGIAVYYVLATAEASANLARFDGVRYGHRAARPRDLGDLYARSRDEAFGAEVKRRIFLGTYVLSSGYYDAYYLRAQKVRTLVRRDLAAAFERCDVIATPTSPEAAFRLGEHMADPLSMYLSDVFTVPANLAGLPAISLPSGLVGGLPAGVQLMAPLLAEPALLQTAAALEAELAFVPLARRREA